MRQNLPGMVDVLPVGLGPVGAAAANLLGRYGVRTLVIEKAIEIFQAPRAIALGNEALRILQMAGPEDGAFATHAIANVQMRSPLFGSYAPGPLDGHPWEDMTETLVPGAAPAGWVAAVRPDRPVLHDGPLKELETVMRESLALLGGAPTREHVPRAVLEVSL